MSQISPHLREQFENLPIDLKNRLLESNVIIDTEEELRQCLEWIKKQDSCCGDL